MPAWRTALTWVSNNCLAATNNGGCGPHAAVAEAAAGLVQVAEILQEKSPGVVTLRGELMGDMLFAESQATTAY